jgi:hypothetical protein
MFKNVRKELNIKYNNVSNNIFFYNKAITALKRVR